MLRILRYGGPKGSITNQFPKTKNNFPKHKSIFQNTSQFTKTQNNFPKHKSVYRNAKQFLKTQTNFPKHKSFKQNTNQFLKHKPISSKHKSKDWTLALLLSESLERTHSQDFPRPTWRLLICCGCSKMFCHNSRCEVSQEYFYCSQCGTKLDIVVPSFR